MTAVQEPASYCFGPSFQKSASGKYASKTNIIFSKRARDLAYAAPMDDAKQALIRVLRSILPSGVFQILLSKEHRDALELASSRVTRAELDEAVDEVLADGSYTVLDGAATQDAKQFFKSVLEPTKKKY